VLQEDVLHLVNRSGPQGGGALPQGRKLAVVLLFPGWKDDPLQALDPLPAEHPLPVNPKQLAQRAGVATVGLPA